MLLAMELGGHQVLPALLVLQGKQCMVIHVLLGLKDIQVRKAREDFQEQKVIKETLALLDHQEHSHMISVPLEGGKKEKKENLALAMVEEFQDLLATPDILDCQVLKETAFKVLPAHVAHQELLV